MKSTSLPVILVKTNQWEKIATGDMDIIRGEKRAGKSAIYSLLMTKAGDFFDKRILLVAAENARGATVFKDLVADPPTTENEFIALWKIYALSLSATNEGIRHLRLERRARNIELLKMQIYLRKTLV
jgi:hypothetical protein